MIAQTALPQKYVARERINWAMEVSTGSDPGSPRGQPAWGGGSDRVGPTKSSMLRKTRVRHHQDNSLAATRSLSLPVLTPCRGSRYLRGSLLRQSDPKSSPRSRRELRKRLPGSLHPRLSPTRAVFDIVLRFAATFGSKLAGRHHPARK